MYSDNRNKQKTKPETQIKKRKPETVNEPKKNTKETNITVRPKEKQEEILMTSLFESLTLEINGKTHSNKKIAFVSTVLGLTESVSSELKLGGNLDLELVPMDNSDQFEDVKKLIKRGVPLIYGYLNTKTKDLSAILEDSLVWKGFNENLGRVWIFNSKQDSGFVIDHHFLPSAYLLMSRNYYLFVLEQRVDGNNYHPYCRRTGQRIENELKEALESKARTIREELEVSF